MIMHLLTYCHDAHFDESNQSRIAVVIAAELKVGDWKDWQMNA